MTRRSVARSRFECSTLGVVLPSACYVGTAVHLLQRSQAVRSWRGTGPPYPGRMDAVIRTAEPGDIAAVLTLWVEADAETSHTDDVEGLSCLMAHDPAALLVAVADGRIVGSVIAAWDGWRGSIYRLAVHPAHRRQGLGRRLVSEAGSRLARLGARRLQAIVVGSEPTASGYWRASGWDEQTDRLRFVKG